MEVTNQDLLQVNEVVSKRWHNLFYINKVGKILFLYLPYLHSFIRLPFYLLVFVRNLCIDIPL